MFMDYFLLPKTDRQTDTYIKDMMVEPVLISMSFELNASPMQIAWLPTMAGLEYERKARVMVVTICFKFRVHVVGERVQSKTCVIH